MTGKNLGDTHLSNNMKEGGASRGDTPKEALSTGTRLKNTIVATSATGFCTGLGWSAFVRLMSLDQVFKGSEFLLSLLLPLLFSLAVWKVSGVKLKILIPLSYFVLVVPLFGLGLGGANVAVMAVAGTLGALFWTLPLLVWFLYKNRSVLK